jgi:hypothetical protein
MSIDVRTGGLVRIPVDDFADARAKAVDAQLEDSTVDWVMVGSDLILYTEQPDLEDKLTAAPGVEHLSYAAVLAERQVQPILARQFTLDRGFRSWRARLRHGERYRGAECDTDAWQQIPHCLRRTIGELPPQVWLSAFNRLSARLGGQEAWNGLAEKLAEFVRDRFGPEASPDRIPDGEDIAVSWTTSYGTAECEDLLPCSMSPRMTSHLRPAEHLP